MPDTKISELSSATTLDGSEVFPLVKAGSTVKATGTLMAGYINTARTQTLPYTLVVGDRGKVLVLTTSGGTLTAPAVGTLGSGAQVLLINDTAGNITIDGPGGTNVTLAAAETATLVEANSKQRVVKGASTVIS